MNKLFDNCKGCRGVKYGIGNPHECLYTRATIQYFNNCCCWNCLIKTVCKDVCDDFKNQLLRDHPIPLPSYYCCCKMHQL